jgi:hypothetical protein
MVYPVKNQTPSFLSLMSFAESYDYTTNAQKLNLFPTTLNNATLQWFMGLGGQSIYTWDDMKQAFLKKYQDYSK